MQILIKLEQFKGSGDVQGWGVKDDDQTLVEIKPLKPNLHVVD